MNDRRKQRVYASIAAIAILLLIVWVGSSILVYFSTGATWDKEVQTANTLDRYRGSIQWNMESDHPNSHLLSTIGVQYARGMHALFLSNLDDDRDLLKDYFAEGDSVLSLPDEEFRFASLPLTHNLELKLLSADKSLVILRDQCMVVEHTKTKRSVEHTVNNISYEVMMTLDDGKWRIRHLTGTTRDNYHIQEGHIHHGIDPVRGINYYPQQTPWLEFWPGYDPVVIERDLELIKSLKLTSVRIFVPYYSQPESAESQDIVQSLIDFVDRAASKNIGVLITLFDFPASYDIRSFAQCDRYIRSIVLPLADHKGVLGWDVKNEPDLDYSVHGRPNVINWLKFTLQRVKSYDNNSFVTIGWSNPQSASTLADNVDVISYHYYQPLAELEESFASILNPTDKPVICTEYGLPTHNSWLMPGGHSESDQAAYYRRIQDFMAKNASGDMSWTLYDFPEVPPYVSGSAPWIIKAQKNYGVVRTDGTLKKAVDMNITQSEGGSPGSRIRNVHISLMILTVLLVVSLVKGLPFLRQKFYER